MFESNRNNKPLPSLVKETDTNIGDGGYKLKSITETVTLLDMYLSTPTPIANTPKHPTTEAWIRKSADSEVEFWKKRY